MKRVFITEYVGLSTRLEALAMAFMIRDYFGHEVCVDWEELDSLQIRGATIRGRGLLGRLDSIKLRGDTRENFAEVGRHRNVVLRTHDGPRHLLDKYLLPTAQRVKLRPDLIDTIRAAFAPYTNRPLVGVHLRRGDFPIDSQDEFDVNAHLWPGVPDWWHEHVMREIQRAVPDVVFFVACSGSLDDYPHLTRDFEVFDLPAETAYDYKHRQAGHQSRRHPAADLFALGCVDTLIGSTCSTFSHYPANMLGRPTTVLVPPAHKIYPAAPEYCRIDMHGRSAFDWYDACRTGRGLVPVHDAATLPITRGAFVDWM